ncbi:hypothetical protein HBI70_144350 [Parastagonospora nodorum]|nr:hypothetical protein HBH54_095510 [Parastagonospora nodorum]KAH4574169.1 hypothetical protein HBH84_090000 [Parastagonospora nodorum]KAH4774272.1 hypothetical protein HBH62_183340 [Parastagonospora nodorum]KAH5055561.1 hypothetical protein HBH96_128640 [Parastagonospora nodorum]KAH5265564.1 hypothetical protein HBI70_144350 [Parastagonospora nodorum]
MVDYLRKRRSWWTIHNTFDRHELETNLPSVENGLIILSIGRSLLRTTVKFITNGHFGLQEGKKGKRSDYLWVINATECRILKAVFHHSPEALQVVAKDARTPGAAIIRTRSV